MQWLPHEKITRKNKKEEVTNRKKERKRNGKIVEKNKKK